MSRYFIFFFVFFSQLIITSPYTLVGRSGHTASYMDNKIYFLGGKTVKHLVGTNDFFYLDVSIPFDLDSTLPIFDLSNDARYIDIHSHGISTICGPNKDMIFLIFGISEESFTYNFIINDQEWDLRSQEPNVRWSSVVCNKNGSYIYVYGSNDVNKYKMTIIDTTHGFTVSSDLNIPNSLATAILLQDGRIAYIGKRIDDLWVNFRNIYIYNTNDGTWRNMSTSGIEPSPRYFHTTVLTQDGLIIIYGGVNNIGPVPDQISVLDTKVDPFTWSIPNIDYAPSSAPFSGHTATLVGNYMIIAFGYYRTATTKSTVLSDQIHMIDVSEKNNYKWVKNFTPLAYPTKSPGAAHAAIIGGTTGGIATVIIIISVSYLLYRRKRTVIYAPQAKHAINC
ncbi:hypothetical protein RhiirA4_546801 [Rhizophagus irregularis]|uniref:Galactose oxidase n=1 Tax=Rhizophagus irregularis TaxID=588596 RepID=A0A2I1GZ05_9GLOM|nr:hypothetical protein RhiirA4_546801 [Rhizophagus irregularis]